MRITWAPGRAEGGIAAGGVLQDQWVLHQAGRAFSVQARSANCRALRDDAGGAPGIDGVTFEAIEAEGAEGFLEQLRQELIERRYRPEWLRKVEIPKEGGKVRQLSIPTVISQCTSAGSVSGCFTIPDSA